MASMYGIFLFLQKTKNVHFILSDDFPRPPVRPDYTHVLPPVRPCKQGRQSRRTSGLNSILLYLAYFFLWDVRDRVLNAVFPTTELFRIRYNTIEFGFSSGVLDQQTVVRRRRRTLGQSATRGAFLGFRDFYRGFLYGRIQNAPDIGPVNLNNIRGLEKFVFISSD